MTEALGPGLIAIGVVFDLVGCIGLVRLPDVYNRIQASTKCVTVGTSFLILGALVSLGTLSAAVKGAVAIAFVLIASATAAHALARAAHRSGVPLWEGSVVDHYAEDGEPRSEQEEATP